MTFDIDEVAAILRRAAAAEILPRFRRLGAGDIREKTGAIDLVTEADEAAERMIAQEVGALIPSAVFIGEESVAADPSTLDKLDDAELAVVVDPVDGTLNFATGVAAFGVMAAVVARGQTVGAVILDPICDDWLIAERGAGTYRVSGDGRRERLRAAAPVPLEEMVGIASTGMVPAAEKPGMLSRLAQVRQISSYRCSAQEYRLGAAGHLHFLMYYKLNPWDHLPGALLIEEAGGYVACVDGTPYTPSVRSGGLLSACDAESWTVLRDAIFPSAA